MRIRKTFAGHSKSTAALLRRPTDGSSFRLANSAFWAERQRRSSRRAPRHSGFREHSNPNDAQRQSHTFIKAIKTSTCRHIEILATMAVHGAWQPSRTHFEADKKAFKRLQAEIQAILPLPGDPFRKEGAQFHPLFELSLPKEHWRDSNEENEVGP
jgi:hypothetical protein